MTAIAYVRKSRSVDPAHEVSREVQEAAVRSLAARHGDTDLVILSDWNRSGRRGPSGRPGYAEVLARIDSGDCHAVYAYSLSRLSRSVRDLADLVDRCRAHKVALRVERDAIDLSTASGEMIANILASMAQFEATVASERAIDAIAARRVRGDRLGRAPFGELPGEDAPAVLTAWANAGTFGGAARLLNAAGVASRSGTPWTGKTVSYVVTRADGGARGPRKAGRPSKHAHVLSKLLRCSCGGLMTGRRVRHRTPYGQYAYDGYQCPRGRYDAAHPRPYMVSEAQLMPWVRAEADRLRMPPIEDVPEDVGDREALEAKRARVIEAFVDGLLDKAERDRRLLALADQLERLDATARALTVPRTIDWAWSPAKLNIALRGLWERVELDADLRPVGAEWAVPEWRA